VPIRPLQLYADGGYQLRIRRLEGTPNYGPRQYMQTFKIKNKKITVILLKMFTKVQDFDWFAF
jgi:hypothetical protein